MGEFSSGGTAGRRAMGPTNTATANRSHDPTHTTPRAMNALIQWCRGTWAYETTPCTPYHDYTMYPRMYQYPISHETHEDGPYYEGSHGMRDTHTLGLLWERLYGESRGFMSYGYLL